MHWLQEHVFPKLRHLLGVGRVFVLCFKMDLQNYIYDLEICPPKCLIFPQIMLLIVYSTAL